MRRLRRKQLLLWLAGVCVLIFLYLASSTDLIIREKAEEVYKISVILDDANDDAYSTFREGVDQAALDLHADVNFITLYQAGDGEEQMERILREVGDGANGLVIVPVQSAAFMDADVQNRITVPAIYVKADMILDNRVNSGLYQFNYRAIGQDLAKRAASYCTKDPYILFVSAKPMYGFREAVCEGSREVLGEDYVSVLSGEDSGSDRILKELKTRPNVVLVALDAEGMDQILNASGEMDRAGVRAAAVFSVGSSVRILNNLRKEKINGLYFTDDYSAGYQTVQNLCGKLNHVTNDLENVEGTYYYVDKKALETGKYDKLLMPME